MAYKFALVGNPNCGKTTFIKYIKNIKKVGCSCGQECDGCGCNNHQHMHK